MQKLWNIYGLCTHKHHIMDDGFSHLCFHVMQVQNNISIFEKIYQPEPQICIEYREKYCRRKNITHGAGAAKISGAQRWWSKTLLHTEPELQNLTQKEMVLQKSKTHRDGTAKNWVKKSLQHCLFFLHFNLAALCKYGPQKLS